MPGSMQSWAEPERMADPRAQPDSRPSRQQPGNKCEGEGMLRSVFGFDVESERGKPPHTGQVGAGARLGGGRAASAGREGIELMDGLDDLADTGLWTP